MKRRIQWVLLLMSVCTAGIVGLQLFWSYQSYLTASRSFTRDINEALQAAVKQEQNARRRDLQQQYRSWLQDTGLVEISCQLDPIYKKTKFFLADRHPWAKEKREPFTLGFNDFNQKLSAITPQAKAFFINRFTEDLVWRDLQEGYLYFYTKRLGDKMEVAYTQNQLNPERLQTFFRKQLNQRYISTDFTLIYKQKPFNTSIGNYPYKTLSYNVSLRKPPQLVHAYFPDPNLVFLQRMKWIIGSTLLLIGVALFCFSFTIKTLFKQKKLAELKNDFVNNMTHELKTPVATISLAAEAIQEFELDQASTQEYVSIIRQQSGRLSGLIDQILQSVTLEQDTLILENSLINLSQLIERVLAQYRPALKAANAHVQVEFASSHLFIWADELHISNAFATILDNAIKYKQRDLSLIIKVYRQADAAQLEVADNGIGIPEEYQGKIFDKFFRVPLGNVHDVKGYGLGLSYARSIAEKHRGLLTVQSQFGKGSTFTLTLPLVPHETTAPVVARR